jgi:hypothetical protein
MLGLDRAVGQIVYETPADAYAERSCDQFVCGKRLPLMLIARTGSGHGLQGPAMHRAN